MKSRSWRTFIWSSHLKLLAFSKLAKAKIMQKDMCEQRDIVYDLKKSPKNIQNVTTPMDGANGLWF